MSIQAQLAKVFADNNWTWQLKQGKAVPSEDDILQVLDRSATLLYTEPVGTELEIGRLIIKKLHTGHDVYCYSGYFE